MERSHFGISSGNAGSVIISMEYKQTNKQTNKKVLERWPDYTVQFV